MEASIRTQCEASLAALDELWRSGVLEDAIYFKAKVAIAYEYVVGEAMNDAVDILVAIPASYYRDHQLAQMREDPKYSELVVYIAKQLLATGTLSVDPFGKPTANA